jgi:hypothetical protein
VTGIRQDVAEIRALRHLDIVDPREVVTWATERLAVGDDQVALLDLALVTDVRAYEVDALVTALAAEIGLEPLTDRAARRTAAELVAHELLRDEITPIAAAQRIWRLAGEVSSAEPDLVDFVVMASEWDNVHLRAGLEQDIRASAAHLVGRDPGVGA